MNDYRKDRDRADAMEPQVLDVLTHELSQHVVSIGRADEMEDTKQATDYIAVTVDATIACRVRFDVPFRDLTLRCWRKSGAETEAAKIRAGFARWYFYGWSEVFRLIDWMFLDLDLLRSSGLLERKWEMTTNDDGITGFISISKKLLYQQDIIVGTSPVYLGRPWVPIGSSGAPKDELYHATTADLPDVSGVDLSGMRCLGLRNGEPCLEPATWMSKLQRLSWCDLHGPPDERPLARRLL